MPWIHNILAEKELNAMYTFFFIMLELPHAIQIRCIFEAKPYEVYTCVFLLVWM
jgi:hypothetical protein